MQQIVYWAMRVPSSILDEHFLSKSIQREFQHDPLHRESSVFNGGLFRAHKNKKYKEKKRNEAKKKDQKEDWSPRRREQMVNG